MPEKRRQPPEDLDSKRPRASDKTPYEKPRILAEEEFSVYSMKCRPNEFLCATYPTRDTI